MRIHFHNRFVDPIEAGTKVHTVRCGKRRYRTGQILQMETGPRFKPAFFTEQLILRVRDITISDRTVMVWSDKDTGCLVPPLDDFARADGFRGWEDLRQFFLAMYGFKGPDGKSVYLVHGQLVQWDVAPWDNTPPAPREKHGCRYFDVCQRKGDCYWQKCRFYKAHDLEVTKP